MFNVSSWSTINNQLISNLVNGFMALDADQKETFISLLGTEVAAGLQSLNDFANKELRADDLSKLNVCVFEFMRCVASKPTGAHDAARPSSGLQQQIIIQNPLMSPPLRARAAEAAPSPYIRGEGTTEGSYSEGPNYWTTFTKSRLFLIVKNLVKINLLTLENIAILLTRSDLIHIERILRGMANLGILSNNSICFLIENIPDLLVNESQQPFSALFANMMIATMQAELLNPINFRLLLLSDLVTVEKIYLRLMELNLLRPLFGEVYLNKMLPPTMANNLDLVLTCIFQHFQGPQRVDFVRQLFRLNSIHHLSTLCMLLESKQLMTPKLFSFFMLNVRHIPTFLPIIEEILFMDADLLTDQCLDILIQDFFQMIYCQSTVEKAEFKIGFPVHLSFMHQLYQMGLFSGDKGLANLTHYIKFSSHGMRYRNSPPKEHLVIYQVMHSSLLNGMNMQLKFDIFLSHHFRYCISASLIPYVIQLEQCGLLVDYANEIFNRPDSEIVAKAMIQLATANRFDETFKREFLSEMLKSQNMVSYAEAYVLLHQNPISFCDGKKAKYLKFGEMKSCHDPLAVLNLSRYFFDHGLLTRKAFNRIKSNTNTFLDLIIDLHEMDIGAETVQRTLSILLERDDDASLMVIAHALQHIVQAGLLTATITPSYLEALLNHVNPDILAESMVILAGLNCDDASREFYRKTLWKEGIACIRIANNPVLMARNELIQLIGCHSAYILHNKVIYFMDRGDIPLPIDTVQAHMLRCTGYFPSQKNGAAPISSAWIDNVRDCTGFEPKSIYSCLSVAQTVSELHGAGILTQDFIKTYFERLLGHSLLRELVSALIIHKKYEALENDPAYTMMLEPIFKHRSPIKLINAYIKLHESGLSANQFTAKNPLSVFKRRDPGTVAGVVFNPRYLKIIAKHEEPLDLVTALIMLSENPVLFQFDRLKNIVNTVITHPSPLSLVEAWIRLNDHELLDTVLLDPRFPLSLMTEQVQPRLYADAIILFDKIGLLDNSKKDNELTGFFYKMVNHPSCRHQLNALSLLSQFEVDQFNIDKPLVNAILQHDSIDEALIADILKWTFPPAALGWINNILRLILELPVRGFTNRLSLIRLLVEANLIGAEMPQINLELINNSHDASTILDAVRVLKKYEVLTQVNINRLASRLFAVVLPVFDQLCIKNNSMTHYLEDFLIHPAPYDFISAINFVIEPAGLLTDSNIRLISEHSGLSEILRVLHFKHLLTQSIFLRLIRFEAIFCSDRLSSLLKRIPNVFINEQLFNQFFRICQENANQPEIGLQRICDYMNYDILRTPRPAPITLDGINLNTQQSTHTASIHRTVSESAMRLKMRYGKQIDNDLDASLREIEKTIFLLDQNEHNDIIRRCWVRLVNERVFEYVDPMSKVSIAQLIVLFWTAVQDFENRSHNGPESFAQLLDEGKGLFFQALYELQRDGNLDEKSVDDGQEHDRVPSCTSGTFNKFIEKLAGIHKDVEFLMITTEGANFKFQCIVRSHLFEAMKQRISEAKNQCEKLPLPLPFDDVMTNLWPKISRRVADELFDEYQSVYKGDRKDPNFVKLVELGPDVQLTDTQIKCCEDMNEGVLSAGQKHQREESEDADEADAPGQSSEKRRARVEHGFFAATHPQVHTGGLSSPEADESVSFISQ